MDKFILQTENVSYAYEEGEGLALKNVSLGFRAGEMTAVLGHNGSGKSTLARALGEFAQPDKTPSEYEVQLIGRELPDDLRKEYYRSHLIWHSCQYLIPASFYSRYLSLHQQLPPPRHHL